MLETKLQYFSLEAAPWDRGGDASITIRPFAGRGISMVLSPEQQQELGEWLLKKELT